MRKQKMIPDFPLELVARVSKMLKMCAKKRKFCGGVVHSTLTHKFSLFRAQIQHIDRSQQSSNGKSWIIVLLVVALTQLGCAAHQSKSNTHTLQYYGGSPKPLPQVAVLKSADLRGKRAAGALVKVELYGINDRRFKFDGGLGDGEFEVHLWPGTYTLQLRFSTMSAPEEGGKLIRSEQEIEFTLTAQAGHTYLLAGDRLAGANDKQVEWRPVMFDKTRVISWKRGDQDADPSGKSSLR